LVDERSEPASIVERASLICRLAADTGRAAAGDGRADVKERVETSPQFVIIRSPATCKCVIGLDTDSSVHPTRLVC